MIRLLAIFALFAVVLTITPPEECYVNNCTPETALDWRGMDTVHINFSRTDLDVYEPPCIWVDLDTVIYFIGDFTSHPLVPGYANNTEYDGHPVVNGTFIPIEREATDNISVTANVEGVFPYYCDYHLPDMKGAIYVGWFCANTTEPIVQPVSTPVAAPTSSVTPTKPPSKSSSGALQQYSMGLAALSLLGIFAL